MKRTRPAQIPMVGLGDGAGLANVGTVGGAPSWRWFVTIAGDVAPVAIFKGVYEEYYPCLLYRSDDGQNYARLRAWGTLQQAAEAGAAQFLQDCGQ